MIIFLTVASHLENNRIEAWTMLSIFRGHIDSMIQFNYQRDNLCPFLVSIAPCVSYKWVVIFILFCITDILAPCHAQKCIPSSSASRHVPLYIADILALCDCHICISCFSASRLVPWHMSCHGHFIHIGRPVPLHVSCRGHCIQSRRIDTVTVIDSLLRRRHRILCFYM